MLPRSKRYAEIKGFLRRPQILQPKLSLDTNIEDYKKALRRYNLYKYVSQYTSHNGIIKDIANHRNGNFYFDINQIVKSQSFHYTNGNHLKILKTYNILKESEMYDESICKMGLLDMHGDFYLSIYFPVIFLQEVNTDRKPIEIRDIYFYLNGSALYAFRTTLDVINMDFVHPHVSGNFSNFCLGSSPLKMSLDNLKYNVDAFTLDDADIFWVNLYRTVTQKTEIGDHYYALDKLNQGITISYQDFQDKVYNNEDFISKVTNYISISISNEAIEVDFDKDSLKKDFFHLFSNESVEQKPSEEPIGRVVSFNGTPLRKKKYVPLYKRPRTMIKNIDGLLDQFLKDCVPTSLINNVYDDYKETTEKSNNSGEQSTGQNQVFEFQML